MKLQHFIFEHSCAILIGFVTENKAHIKSKYTAQNFKNLQNKNQSTIKDLTNMYNFERKVKKNLFWPIFFSSESKFTKTVT